MKGQILEQLAKVYDDNGMMVVHKAVPAGGNIPAHNHPGFVIFFTPVKGEFHVTLSGEKHELVPGKVLNFNGEETISATCDVDSEVFIYLRKLA